MSGWEWQSIFFFFRGSLFTWPHVDTKGHATASMLIFPGGQSCVMLCFVRTFWSRYWSVFHQDCSQGFVWLAPPGCWGKASWVLSPFQDILIPSLWYSIKTTHYRAATRPVPQVRTADETISAPLKSLFSLPIATIPLVHIFTMFFTALQCPTVREDSRNTHSSQLTYKHADEMKRKPVRRQTAVSPPRTIALWLLVTIVWLCSQALTSGDNGQKGKRAWKDGVAQTHIWVHAQLIYACNLIKRHRQKAKKKKKKKSTV